MPSPLAQCPPTPVSPAPPPPHPRRAEGSRWQCPAPGRGSAVPTLPVDWVPLRTHRYTTSQARTRQSAGSHCTRPLSWMDGEMLRVFLYQKYCVEDAFSHSSS